MREREKVWGKKNIVGKKKGKDSTCILSKKKTSEKGKQKNGPETLASRNRKKRGRGYEKY